MKYLEEMVYKMGFGDGEQIPDGVEVYREVYIRAINQVAAAMGSESRAVAYNRPGVHNPFLILFTSVEEFHQLGAGEITSGDANCEYYGGDDKIAEAIEWLQENVDLDGLISVRISYGKENFKRTMGTAIRRLKEQPETA